MAERVLGRRKREKTRNWFDEECQHVITSKYIAYIITQQKIVQETQYKSIELLEETRIYKNKKNNYSENKLKELEHLIYMNENRASCKNLNRSHKDVKPRIQLCIDANGENLNRKN